MIAASLYIIACSARNRLRVRLRRLREPRYLLGAIAGVAYIYFSFFARLRSRTTIARRRRAAPVLPAEVAALAASGPALAGLALMLLTALGWLFPFDSGLLEFSAAETQFLIPAPVSRRALLIHRMMRSQLGMLFGGVIAGLAAPSLPGYQRVRVAIGTWLLMCTGKIYFTGISLARSRLGAQDPTARRTAWLPLGVLGAAIAIVGSSIARAYLASPVVGVGDALLRLGAVATHGAAHVVLWPFMALVWPLFAEWPGPYLWSLAGAAVVLVATITWVLKSDAAFQHAAEEVAERKAREPAARKASYRARGTAWQLAADGRAEMVFAWKAAMQTLRVADKRSIARLVAIFVALSISTASLGRGSGFAVLLGVFATIGSIFAVLMAPQAIRMDMRQDLQHLELLKTWPVRSSAVIRGELMWPGALITAIAWLMIGMATVLSAAVFARVGVAWRLSVGGASMVVAPALVFAQLVIQNAAALIFPAWVPLGAQRPRGLDAMGQRLIMLGGTLLMLIVMTLPGAIAGAIVWFALGGFIGPAALVPGAIACTVVLAIEVAVATEMLAPLYDRLDLTAVERAE